VYEIDAKLITEDLLEIMCLSYKNSDWMMDFLMVGCWTNGGRATKKE
jgi:hypothetical protein